MLRISEFSTADAGVTLNPASEQIMFQMAQPGGHNNGGHLLFGPDGFLYLGIGDGGNDDSASGVAGNGQLTNNLLGKILRIDVSGTQRHAPLSHSRRQSVRRQSAVQHRRHRAAGLSRKSSRGDSAIRGAVVRQPGRPVVAGRRRFAYARGGESRGRRRQLWLALLRRHTADRAQLRHADHAAAAPGGRIRASLGSVVTGGFVYHGTAIPALVGRYVFADYSSGTHLEHRDRHGAHAHDGRGGRLGVGREIASFAEDNDGELYLVDVRTSSIYRIVPRLALKRRDDLRALLRIGQRARSRRRGCRRGCASCRWPGSRR